MPEILSESYACRITCDQSPSFRCRESISKIDFDLQLLKPIFYDIPPKYVKNMGVPELHCVVCKGFKACRVTGKNQKAVFLDRDGAINKYVDLLNSWRLEMEKSM